MGREGDHEAASGLGAEGCTAAPSAHALQCTPLPGLGVGQDMSRTPFWRKTAGESGVTTQTAGMPCRFRHASSDRDLLEALINRHWVAANGISFGEGGGSAGKGRPGRSLFGDD
jgi:hypothetical protein